MPFKRDSALQNTPVLKQPFKTQPQIENEDERHLKSSIQSVHHKNQQV